MKTIQIKATYIGNGNMGYAKNEDYEIMLFVYEDHLSLITPSDKHYEFKDIIALLRNFDNIQSC